MPEGKCSVPSVATVAAASAVAGDVGGGTTGDCEGGAVPSGTNDEARAFLSTRGPSTLSVPLVAGSAEGLVGDAAAAFLACETIVSDRNAWRTGRGRAGGEEGVGRGRAGGGEPSSERPIIAQKRQSTVACRNEEVGQGGKAERSKFKSDRVVKVGGGD